MLKLNLTQISVIFLIFSTFCGVLGASSAFLNDSDRISALETEMAQVKDYISYPTNTPSPTATLFTATRTPSPTRTSVVPNTPTPEEPTTEVIVTMSATPTFAPGTNTPTRTPSPTRTVTPTATQVGAPTATPDPFWYLGCEPDGIFTANRNINRRTGKGTNFPVIQRDGKSYVLLTGEEEAICWKSLDDIVTPNTLIWVQAAEPTPVFFVVGFVEADGTITWWGTLEILRD